MSAQAEFDRMIHDDARVPLGKQFDRLTIIGRPFAATEFIKKEASERHGGRRRLYYVVCQCSCGKATVIQIPNLVGVSGGRTRSCGCLQRESARIAKLTHGFSGRSDTFFRRLYGIWKNMRRRCENAKDSNYRNYGARGIYVCTRWRKLEEFVRWSLNNGYAETLTLDRINPDKSYTPKNCQWITKAENSRKIYRDRRVQIDSLQEEVARLKRRIDELEGG